ncbi:MAG: threonine/serine dehydratase [Gemmatimonadota bacterium]|nr:threonine/serine dehydratase [Gemmatimonadota bacterium]
MSETGISLESMRLAARQLAGIAWRTPLVETVALGAEVGVPVSLKCEHLQPVGAFKIRGAYTAVARLAPDVRRQGVVTSSSGNHGLALAWVARHFGVRCVVVMPESAPGVKSRGVAGFGGEVVFAGKTRSPEQGARAAEIARVEGLVMVPPFDHPDVVAGQATCGLEIIEQAPALAAVLVPVGGGGLLAGIAAAMAALRPEVEVIGVEPAGAPKLSAALRAGAPVELGETSSLADGLLTRSVGATPWTVIRERVRRAVQVSDEDLRLAVRHLWHRQGLRVEPSGAASAAALLAGKVKPAGPVVAVLSGGNVDPDLFAGFIQP